MTISFSATARCTASRICAGSSLTIAYRVQVAPSEESSAAAITVLLSTTCPGAGREPWATSSLPVGMSPTFTEMTSSPVIPYAASAPSSCGRIRCREGRTISDSPMSSPAGRTCCHGAAALRIVNRSPSAQTSSIMMTASYPAGTTLPVFTRTAPASVTGRCSLAPAVSSLRTAIPSIAARWISGTE